MTYKRRKTKATYWPSGRAIVKAFSLKPVGPWSVNLLKSETGKYLNYKHLEIVAKRLEKAKPKNKKEAEKAVKEAMDTPAAQFLILYELSLTRPLTDKEFMAYLSLFNELFPEAYKAIYGNKKPPKILEETRKLWKMSRCATLRKSKR